MVTRLPLPETCSLELADAILNERAKGRNADYFKNIYEEWRKRIEVYLADHGNPETVPRWPAINENSTPLLTLYKAPKQQNSQYPVLKSIRNGKLQFCPSCGEEGSPRTIDHYLPKEIYPHFCVTPANLTPMCDACQTAKGTKTLDKHGRRIFLHPYFDDFLTSQVVRLIVGRPFNAPEDFELVPIDDLEPAQAALVWRHIDGLNMQERYGAFFRDEYIRLLHLSQEARDQGLDIVDDIPVFLRLHRKKALNLWPYIFYTAVMADNELLDYLRKGDLPEHI